MHPFEAKQPERLAMYLGYAGLIPFVSGALGVWVAPSSWRPFVMTALLDYAAVILAFMGAIHWGLAMRAQANDERARLQLGLSVIPPLLGWVAIASGKPFGLVLPILLFAFVMLYFADLRATALGLAPQWYPALRRPLTLVVSISLLLAWASLLRA
ncbi:DUF3429 domain-containing protein [Aquipseudomonas alcaligenes]|uniref:DUF3429 domain-containing protein n=1 Tax=Aquipseudomonas alcaligenes (strain ATCC 14909 / DSM 50342 / CCUG 1425 / JCM 20561 / NBRC 14159 / NCIMB 9945 / NCTC 10367 / 1577) TaxID=1215092 RepID=U2Z8Y1_AQUA1|nr:DUF3429 domain-containing protein [Pseudomonas alcaligenes]GAD64186.1 hypothetical protein PA6_034_00280 [Pseudomonas alcaligenes NBRC 14159]SUD18459.1 Protein of uncharacterised function (DUF3429) [Pseudomonas alcaligenes]